MARAALLREYVDGAARGDPRVPAAARCSRWPDVTRRARSAPALEPIKGHPMAKAAVRDRAARRRAARVRRRRFGAYLGAVRDRGACRRLGRHHGLDPASCSTRSTATSPRATCGSSSRSSPAGTSSRSAPSASGSATTCCSRSTPTPRTRLADARALARLDAVRPAADRAAAARGRPARARRARQAHPHAGLPRRVDHLGRARRRRDRARRVLGRQHQARPGRRLPGGRAGSTTCARPTACRCGAAGCWRPASAGRPTSRWRRCPTSRCPGDTSASEPVLRPGHHRAVRARGRHVRGADRPGHRRRRRSRSASRRSRRR